MTSPHSGPRVTIIDFGICTLLDGSPLLSQPLSTKKRALNCWSAPEILNGEMGNRTSDVFSLAVLFRWLLEHMKPPRPYLINNWIKDALNPDPNQRPSSNELLPLLQDRKERLEQGKISPCHSTRQASTQRRTRDDAKLPPIKRKWDESLEPSLLKKAKTIKLCPHINLKIKK